MLAHWLPCRELAKSITNRRALSNRLRTVAPKLPKSSIATVVSDLAFLCVLCYNPHVSVDGKLVSSPQYADRLACRDVYAQLPNLGAINPKEGRLCNYSTCLF